MKKTGILLLLLAATIAVTWWYFFPIKYPDVSVSNTIFPRAPEVAENTVSVRPTPAPWLPLAEVSDAVYQDPSDVAWSVIYEIIWWSSLDRVRTDGDTSYPGEVFIKEWKVAMQWWEIVAGAFLIDMASITLKWWDPLVLQEIISEADLDIAQFPEASFILQESFGDTVRGILTIKGISKEITFPALVLVSDATLRIYTEFSIDRSEWNITWNSETLSPYIDLRLERILKRQ